MRGSSDHICAGLELKLTNSQVRVGPGTLILGICGPAVADAAKRPVPSQGSPFSLLPGHHRRGLSAARAGVSPPPPASLRRPELTEQPPQRLPRAGLGKVAPTQLCGLGGCGSPLGASGRGRALRRVEDARVTRGGRAAEPGVRAAPPLVVTPRSGAAEPPARAPLPVRLPGTQPRAPAARPGSRGRSPAPRPSVPHLRPAVRAS